jgi:hypothetical protein
MGGVHRRGTTGRTVNWIINEATTRRFDLGCPRISEDISIVLFRYTSFYSFAYSIHPVQTTLLCYRILLSACTFNGNPEIILSSIQPFPPPVTLLFLFTPAYYLYWQAAYICHPLLVAAAILPYQLSDFQHHYSVVYPSFLNSIE